MKICVKKKKKKWPKQKKTAKKSFLWPAGVEPWTLNVYGIVPRQLLLNRIIEFFVITFAHEILPVVEPYLWRIER